MVINVLIWSCDNKPKSVDASIIDDTTVAISYDSYGEKINDSDVLTSDAMMAHYKNLKLGDTISSKLKGKIVEVCPKTGCWMTLDVKGDKTVLVRFKDYGFFMPLDAKGEAIVDGKAFVTETSVEELRHYAEDAGKSAEEIAAITMPKMQYRFEAEGVLLIQ